MALTNKWVLTKYTSENMVLLPSWPDFHPLDVPEAHTEAAGTCTEATGPLHPEGSLILRYQER